MEESKSIKGTDHESNLDDSGPKTDLKYLNKRSSTDL